MISTARAAHAGAARPLAAREKLAGKRFIDDEHERRVEAILRRELAAVDDARADRPEVAVTHMDDRGGRRVLAGRHGRPGILNPLRSPLPRNGGSLTAAAETMPGSLRTFSITSVYNARLRRRARVAAPARRLAVAAGRRIPARVDGELDRDQPVRIEPGIDVHQRDEASTHQAGADDQNHGERDLRDDEPDLSRLPSRADRAATTFAQHVLNVRRRRPPRRHEAEKQAGDNRQQQREREHRRHRAGPLTRAAARRRERQQARGQQPWRARVRQHRR